MHEQRIGAASNALLDRAEPTGATPGKRTLTSELEPRAGDRAIGPVQPVPTAPAQPNVAQPKDGTPAPTPTGPAPTPTGPAPTGTPAGPGTSIAAGFNATRIAFPSAPSFGEVDWNAHEPTATYAAYRDGASSWRFRLETLALRVPVGVSSGGRTNVPSAAAPVVTAATWRTVASDLTPGGGTPNRSPRTTFWAEDLTLTHEIFHFNEFNTFLRTSFGSFETTIEGAGYTEAATATDTEAAALGRKAADLHTRLLAAWNQAKTNMAPGMEDRAYDDGAASYQARADAVRARAATAGWT
jgi:hypothetical protein